MNKKFNLGLIFILLTIVLFGCKLNTEIPTEDELVFAIPEDFQGIMQNKKVYITSVGQSIDIENFMTYIVYLAENIKYDFDYVYDLELEASEIEEDAIVFIIVGCSIKAMSDAGITVNTELARAKEFVALCEKGKTTLISWHLGGMSRRGTTSDDLIEIVFAGSNLNIFVKAGNGDYFLSETSVKNNIPMYQITTISSITEPLMLLLIAE
ncbi:MAG TPA: DUF6305 family protein [Bacilli bacterium]|nr:DUF6305 family protein [Bacilli bacterium]